MPLAKNEIFDPDLSPKKSFWCRKVKRQESSETRFRQVSWRQNEKIRTLPSDVNGHFRIGFYDSMNF